MNIAHKRKDETIQTTEDHCRNVADIAASYGKNIQAENICRVSGLFHDVGKMCQEFNSYINKEKNIARGQVDHSYAGARFITEFSGGAEKCGDTVKLIARTITSHHALQDIYDRQAATVLYSAFQNT